MYFWLYVKENNININEHKIDDPSGYCNNRDYNKSNIGANKGNKKWNIKFTKKIIAAYVSKKMK